MQRRLFAFVTLAIALATSCALRPAPASAMQTHLTHIYYIMMENQSFDEVIGRHQTGSSAPYIFDTPFITSLLTKYGVNTLEFGTTHPSLPNYLSLIAGDYFKIQDDNPSCFAVPAQSPCDTAHGNTLVDQLESKGMTWAAMEQSMPSPGYLGPQWPASTTGPTLYAQKHNPFVYFSQIAKNSSRLANIMPLKKMTDLSAVLSRNFVFVVPDQCHDMHGTSTCSNYDKLLQEGDKYVQQLVTTITSSKYWTTGSAIILTWDEDDYSSNLGCCGSLFNNGGGHMAMIVLTSHYKTPVFTAIPSNHYDELATIEDAFGLTHIGMAAKEPATLFPLFL